MLADEHKKLRAADDHRLTLDWTQWNQALTALNILAPAQIVSAAHRIDETFWRLNIEMQQGALSERRWRNARTAIISAHLSFVNVTRGDFTGEQNAIKTLKDGRLEAIRF